MTHEILTHTLETMGAVAAKPSKYGNRKTVVDGIAFASAFTRKLPVYRIKAKLFAAINGFEIREV